MFRESEKGLKENSRVSLFRNFQEPEKVIKVYSVGRISINLRAGKDGKNSVFS